MSGPDGEVLALLVGLKSEVVGEARLYEGFYRGGRSGTTRLLSTAEALVYARARRLPMGGTGPVMPRINRPVLSVHAASFAYA